MHPPRGMETSLGHAHWSFKKILEGAHVARGMLIEVPCHVDTFGSPRWKLPTEEKTKQNKETWKRKIKPLLMRFKGDLWICALKYT